MVSRCCWLCFRVVVVWGAGSSAYMGGEGGGGSQRHVMNIVILQ